MLEHTSVSVCLLSALVIAPLIILSILARAHPDRTIAGVLYDAEQSGRTK